ncbi:MAG: hypothetical protein P8P74_01170 [Crocinitomicaceae bacterium]|nr:hypothetical protein [Crocinitomicaceae bacterium]
MTALLAIVFFANITFAHSVDFHLYQGELQSFAIFGEKASCSKMTEAEMAAPRSCCDVKKKFSGLSFKQKSCCESVQLVQDNLLNKPSVDIDQSVWVQFDFTNLVHELHVPALKEFNEHPKVEIPPPPNVVYQSSLEHLQVFII